MVCVGMMYELEDAVQGDRQGKAACFCPKKANGLEVRW